MIINTGARTDTAQWYAPWLLRRFAEGYVLVRNPRYLHKVSRYELDPAVVDCVVFCSKNYAPLLSGLHAITERFNTHFHYTITAYGADIEPEVPDLEQSVETLIELERQVGSRRICWRYDPVLLTERYTVERHLETFSWLAERLAGHVDRCIFSFVEMYKKLEHNFPELSPIGMDDRDRLARGLGEIAARREMPIQTCGNNGLWPQYGIGRSACMTLGMLGEANGVEFKKLKHVGQRTGCGCFDARDIGAYDSCPNGCRYCYANRDHALAVHNYLHEHDPASPLLLGSLTAEDEVTFASQRSILMNPGQLTMAL